MDLTARAKNLILQPRQEWQVIEKEPSTVADLYKSYILPLAAIGPVASIIGLSIVGISVPFSGTYRIPLGSAIAQAVASYILSLAAVYILGLIIDALAPNFGGFKDHVQALKVAAYSSTAAWLAGIFILIPALGILQILGLYSLYLLYLGLPPLMKAPPQKAFLYTTVVVIAALIIFAIIGAVAGLFIPPPVVFPQTSPGFE